VAVAAIVAANIFPCQALYQYFFDQTLISLLKSGDQGSIPDFVLNILALEMALWLCTSSPDGK
jgi:hypothetical protein